jgi:hypothetical protein
VLSAFSRCLPDAVRRSKLFAGVRGAMGCLCAAREAKLRERAATESPSPVASSTLVAVVGCGAAADRAGWGTGWDNGSKACLRTRLAYSESLHSNGVGLRSTYAVYMHLWLLACSFSWLCSTVPFQAFKI